MFIQVLANAYRRFLKVSGIKIKWVKIIIYTQVVPTWWRYFLGSVGSSSLKGVGLSSLEGGPYLVAGLAGDLESVEI